MTAKTKAVAKTAAPKATAPKATAPKTTAPKATASKATATVKKVEAKAATAPKKAGKSDIREEQRIVVLVKQNPARPGTARYTRIESLNSSKTVGDFLKKEPGWISTVRLALSENRIGLEG